jgi:hypothetical protein
MKRRKLLAILGAAIWAAYFLWPDISSDGKSLWIGKPSPFILIFEKLDSGEYDYAIWFDNLLISLGLWLTLVTVVFAIWRLAAFIIRIIVRINHPQ